MRPPAFLLLLLCYSLAGGNRAAIEQERPGRPPQPDPLSGRAGDRASDALKERILLLENEVASLRIQVQQAENARDRLTQELYAIPQEQRTASQLGQELRQAQWDLSFARSDVARLENLLHEYNQGWRDDATTISVLQEQVRTQEKEIASLLLQQAPQAKKKTGRKK